MRSVSWWGDGRPKGFTAHPQPPPRYRKYSLGLGWWAARPGEEESFLVRMEERALELLSPSSGVVLCSISSIPQPRSGSPSGCPEGIVLKVTRRVSSFFLQQVHIYVSRTTQVHSSPSFQTQCFHLTSLACWTFSHQKRRSRGETSRGASWRIGVTSHVQRVTKGGGGPPPCQALGMGVNRGPQSSD